jgi:hypothetical protein
MLPYIASCLLPLVCWILLLLLRNSLLLRYIEPLVLHYWWGSLVVAVLRGLCLDNEVNWVTELGSILVLP